MIHRLIKVYAALAVAGIAAGIQPVGAADSKAHVLKEETLQAIESALPAHAKAKPRKLLIFTRSDYDGHNAAIAASNEAFTRMSKKNGAFETVISSDPSVFKRESLNQFDAVFLNNTIGRTCDDPALRANLLEFVTGGGGLMGDHGAVIAFTKDLWPAQEDWPEFGYMLGARGYAHHHGNTDERITIAVNEATHPIVRAFDGQSFEMNSEFFRHHEPYSRKRVRVLLSIDADKTDLSRYQPGDPCLRADKDYALAWVRRYGLGRVFYTCIGHGPEIFENPKMLQFFQDAIQFVFGDLEVPTTPSAYLSPSVLSQEKLGWRIGVEAYTFHKFTFFETIEKTAGLGLPYIGGLSFMQRVSKDIPKNFDQNLSDDELQQIRLKMESAGVRLLTYYAQNIPGDEPGCRKLFEFGRKMGVETFICEPKADQLDLLDKLANEYGINVAIHNHGPNISSNNWNPEQILALCQGRSKRIGAAPDLGYWFRNGVDPVEAVRLLKDRILTVQMHDLHERSPQGHDVPWGTGAGNSEEFFRELLRYNIKPTMIGLEYSHDFANNFDKVAKCAEFFNDITLKLAAETPDAADSDWETKLRTDMQAMAENLTATLNPWPVPDRVFEVDDHGAVADGKTINTVAIQKAIDACSAAGGGVVLFAKGDYVTGTLDLRSGVMLEIAEGARLLGSLNLADYPERIASRKTVMDTNMGMNQSLIFAEGVERIGIRGKGTIDFRGDQKNFPGKQTSSATPGRPFGMRIIDSKQIVVEDITLKDSACWLQNYLNCEDLIFQRMKVQNQANHNNDGIDIDGCRRVIVRDCFINSEDDAICIKGCSFKPTEDVLIEKSTFVSACNAFKFGTDTQGDFRRIYARNLKIGGIPENLYCQKNIHQCSTGITLATVDGGDVEDLLFSDIVIERTHAPIFMRIGKRGRVMPGMPTPKVGALRRVVFERISGNHNVVQGSFISGIAERPIENVAIRNIRLSMKGGGTAEMISAPVPDDDYGYPDAGHFTRTGLPSMGFYVRHARGIEFSNIEITSEKPDARPTFAVGANAENVFIDGKPFPPIPLTDSVTDVDGNVYGTVKIGKKVWTTSNLRTTRFNDGSPIPQITGNEEWKAASGPAFCYFDNNPENAEPAGLLYNWYAASSPKIAPKGWRVPTREEQLALRDYLIANGFNYDETTEGNKIAKAMSVKEGWLYKTSDEFGKPVPDLIGMVGNQPETNNRTGYSARPAGSRWAGWGDGKFHSRPTSVYWWSVTPYSDTEAYHTSIHTWFNKYGDNHHQKEFGFSIRLIRDEAQ